MTAALLLLAAGLAFGGQGSNGSAPAPYYPRSTSSNQSLGAINRNFADVTGRNRDRNVPVVGDQDCSVNGGALVGATEKGGYIFGGTCTPINSSSAQFIIATSSGFTAQTIGTGSYERSFSTVCITIPASGKMTVWYTGNAKGSVSNGLTSTTYIIDGAFDAGFDKNSIITTVLGADPSDVSFTVHTSVKSAGTHCVGLGFVNPGSGTGQACASIAAVASPTGVSKCEFGVSWQTGE